MSVSGQHSLRMFTGVAGPAACLRGQLKLAPPYLYLLHEWNPTSQRVFRKPSTTFRPALLEPLFYLRNLCQL